MSEVIAFSVPGSKKLYKLPLGSTMIHFIESDFTYFWEQCIEIAHKFQAGGESLNSVSSALREYIRGSHPYCNALIGTEFKSVVLDCVIDYLCMADGVGLEELWVKNLSAKDAFGRAVYRRITEYKAGLAINQWSNVLRMQAYAASKTAFLFGGKTVPAAEYEARRIYFDMAFRLTADELGCDNSALPRVRRYSVPLLPESMNMLTNAVNTLEPMVKSLTGGRRAKLPNKGRECIHDLNAGIAVNAMMNLPRPFTSEIMQFTKMYKDLPAEVYEPSCFKAIIDLEFDKLLENGLLIQISPATGSYTVVRRPGTQAPSRTGAYQPEAESAQPFEEELEIGEAGQSPNTADSEGDISDETEIEAEPPSEGEQEDIEETEPDSGADAESAADERPEIKDEKIELAKPKKTRAKREPEPKAAEAGPVGVERAQMVLKMSQDPRRGLRRESTEQEVNARCKLICSGMHVRIGWNVTAEEIREWFKHFTHIRRLIGTGELTTEDLEKYLDATEEIYGPPPGGSE